MHSGGSTGEYILYILYSPEEISAMSSRGKISLKEKKKKEKYDRPDGRRIKKGIFKFLKSK